MKLVDKPPSVTELGDMTKRRDKFTTSKKAPYRG
jgi:hypothetical protein